MDKDLRHYANLKLYHNYSSLDISFNEIKQMSDDEVLQYLDMTLDELTDDYKEYSCYVTLKLTDYIFWSWWLVLAPFYAPLLIFLAIWFIAVLIK